MARPLLWPELFRPQLVPRDPAPDHGPLAIERSRHARDVAVVLAQKVLELAARRGRTRPSSERDPRTLLLRAPNGARQMLETDAAVRRQRHRVLDRLFQLADVERPVVKGKRPERGRVDAPNAARRKMRGERTDVLGTLAQRWDPDRFGAQAGHKIRTQRMRILSAAEPAGGRQNAHVDPAEGRRA